MIIVNGLSVNFEKKINTKDDIKSHITEIIPKWFHEIDQLYFTQEYEKIEINLNDFDKKIITNSIDCFDKLKTLSFKENVIVNNL